MANYEKAKFVQGEYDEAVGCRAPDQDLKDKGMVLRSARFKLNLKELNEDDEFQLTVWRSKKKGDKSPSASITLTKITEDDNDDSDDVEDELVF